MTDKLVNDIHSARRAVALLNPDPGLHIGEQTESENIGQYCGRIGEIAMVEKFDGPCTGMILRKGDGVNGQNDKYGESYREPCPIILCLRRKRKLVI